MDAWLKVVPAIRYSLLEKILNILYTISFAEGSFSADRVDVHQELFHSTVFSIKVDKQNTLDIILILPVVIGYS